jgi:Bacterial protein of unknown function (DUF922)
MGFVPARAGARERRPEQPAAGRAATCLPHLTVAPDAATIRMLLRRADAGTRERLAATIQRFQGNGALRQALAPAGGLPVQRWAVGLPRSTTDCERIVAYMNSSSPYAATSGWAQTRARFRWHGEPEYTEVDGSLTAAVSNPRVTPAVSVDMPRWSPTDPAIRDAWSTSMGELRAHETRHEEIAATWETTLLGRLSALSVPMASRDRAAFTTAVQGHWDGWLAEHQADQILIDPFYATFTCPTPIEEPEAAPAPE